MSPDAAARTIMHLTDERDTLAAELAALRVRHSDTLKSFVAQTKIAVRAMAERDAALATIERVEALADAWDRETTGDEWGPYSFTIALRQALEPAQASPQEAAGATEAPEGTGGGRAATEPAASLTGTSKPTKET